MIYDIIICGASLGGTLSAYSAAKLGKNVLLLEDSIWIGGQLTSQAVPPDEHKWIEKEGSTLSYREYRRRVREHYINDKNFKRTIIDKDEIKNVDDMTFCPASSLVSRISHPPLLALKLLNEMLEPYVGKNLTIYTNAKLLSAKTNNHLIESVTYLIDNKEITFYGKIFIDGTDTGDLLPLTNTKYRLGSESYSETKEKHAKEVGDINDVQPFIYTLAFKKHDSGNYTIKKPKNYDYYRSLKMPYDDYPIFSMYGPDSSTGKAKRFGMFENEKDEKGNDLFPLFIYRRIVSKDNYVDNSNIDDITLLNWPMNDYFFKSLYSSTDRDIILNEAKEFTLSFFYYLQTEVERPDGGYGYPNFELLYDVLGSNDGLSLSPYIRESRRIVPLFIITEEMVEEGSNPKFIDSVGVGSYPIDIHITTKTNEFYFIPTERFTIPLGALIPIETINLLPASKNIGTTHITNGCFRLHPIEWNIGESVGILASFVLDKNITIKEVYYNKEYLKEYQELLVKNGIQLYWSNNK